MTLQTLQNSRVQSTGLSRSETACNDGTLTSILTPVTFELVSGSDQVCDNTKKFIHKSITTPQHLRCSNKFTLTYVGIDVFIRHCENE